MRKLKLQTVSILLFCLCAWTGTGARADFREAEQVTLLELQPSPDPNHDWQLDILIGSRTETLLLNPSLLLNSTAIIDQFGHSVPRTTNTTHYAGIIENSPDSWVRISLGEATRGIVFADGAHYDIVPVTDTTARLRQLEGDTIEKLLANQGGDVMHFPPALNSSSRATRQALTIPTDTGDFFDQPVTATKVVHMGIVIDTRYNEARAGRGVDLAIATINSVDGLYREQMGIAVSLDTTLLMTDPATDPLRLDGQSTEEMLLAFRNYRRNTDLLATDLNLVHFFTGNPSVDANIGLAFIGAACRSDGYDVSLSVPFQYPVLLAAHEIGHNLGALHDDVTSCAASGDRVMHSQISSQTTESFSNCSLEAITEQLTHATCLSEAIDMQVTATKLSDTQAMVEAHNLDTNRAVIGSQLRIELTNANITSLPASCELDSTLRANCPTSALAAGSADSITFEYQLVGNQEAILYTEVDVIGALDLQPANNSTSVVLAEASTPDDDPDTVANTDPAQSGNTTGGSGGGGVGPWLLLGLAAGASRTRRDSRR